jgi:hypothetical protein
MRALYMVKPFMEPEGQGARMARYWSRNGGFARDW